MYFKRNILVFSIILLFNMSSCSLFDNAKNEEGSILCDISVQYSQEDEMLKAEVQFSKQSSDVTSPYFIDSPVRINGLVMEKKVVEEKGLFYKLKFSDSKGKLNLEFEDLLGKTYSFEKEVRTNRLDLGCEISTGQKIKTDSITSLIFITSTMLEFVPEGNEIYLDERFVEVSKGNYSYFTAREEKVEIKKDNIIYKVESKGLSRLKKCP